MQSIINVCRFGSKGYASGVFGDFEVTFLEKWGGYSYFTISLLFSGYVWRSIFPCLQYFKGYLMEAGRFSVLNSYLNYIEFFFSKLSYFDILLIIKDFRDRIFCDFRGDYKLILKVFFPHIYSFFLAGRL